MLPCAPDTVYMALSWIHSISCSHGRDLLSALSVALTDAACHAVHLICTDLPDRLDALLTALPALAAGRPVNIFYLLDPGGQLDRNTQHYLQCLTQATGGSCYVIAVGLNGGLEKVWLNQPGLVKQTKKSGLFKSWILYFVCFIEIIPCTLSGDSTIYWVKPINSANTLFSQVLLAFHFSLSPTKHFSPSAQVCHQHWPVFYDLSNRNTSKILFVCTTLLSIKIISSMTCETLLGFPGAVWVILSVLLPPACCLVKPWVQSSSQDAECWPGGRWMASTTWALQYNKYRWKDPVWLQTAVITTGRCLDNSTLLVLCPFQHNWLKWNNDHEACFKGYVHPKMIIQSLSTYPYISGPQNVSGDSCQNSVASFSETPETDGDFFIKH